MTTLSTIVCSHVGARALTTGVTNICRSHVGARTLTTGITRYINLALVDGLTYGW